MGQMSRTHDSLFKKRAMTVHSAQQALFKALLYSFFVWLAAAVITIVVCHYLQGVRGFYGALMGCVLGMAFFFITAFVTAVSMRLPANFLMAIMLGSWIIKMVIVIGIVNYLSHKQFFDHLSFGVATIISLVCVLSVQVIILSSRRIAIVDEPESE